MSESRSIAYQRATAISLAILSTIAVTTTLMHLKAIMVPFVLSLFLYFMLTPSVDWLVSNLKLHRGLASLLTIVVGVLFAAVIIMIVSDSVKSFAGSLNLYKDRIADSIEFLVDGLGKLGVHLDKAAIREQIHASQLFSFVQQFTGQFMGVVGNITLIFVYLMFLLPSGSGMAKENKLLQTITAKVSTYIWTKFGTSVFTGLTTAIILAIIGVDLALMFGVLAFMLNFIPNIGSLISVLLPLPMALLQFGFGWQTLAALIISGIIQFGTGNFLEPKLMGKSLDLHSVTLLFFLLFWGVVWGLPGMFLAVPITAIVKFTLEQFSSTKPIAELLAGRLPQNS